MVVEHFETFDLKQDKIYSNKTGTITEEKAEEVLMNTKWRKAKLGSHS